MKRNIVAVDVETTGLSFTEDYIIQLAAVKFNTDFNVIDEYGNRDVKTANGMYVRSQQEKIIYDELYNRGIRVEYEHTIFYKDENDETKPLHPDFFLPDYKLFIEHWGYENTKISISCAFCGFTVRLANHKHSTLWKNRQQWRSL